MGCFKGFCEEVDSFGAFQYKQTYYEERHGTWFPEGTPGIAQLAQPYLGCGSGPWTGGHCMKCSNLRHDINAPPDVMAADRNDRKKLHEVMPKDPKARVLIVGLAFDFCVLDSAINAREQGY